MFEEQMYNVILCRSCIFSPREIVTSHFLFTFPYFRQGFDNCLSTGRYNNVDIVIIESFSCKLLDNISIMFNNVDIAGNTLAVNKYF